MRSPYLAYRSSQTPPPRPLDGADMADVEAEAQRLEEARKQLDRTVEQAGKGRSAR